MISPFHVSNSRERNFCPQYVWKVSICRNAKLQEKFYLLKELAIIVAFLSGSNIAQGCNPGFSRDIWTLIKSMFCPISFQVLPGKSESGKRVYYIQVLWKWVQEWNSKANIQIVRGELDEEWNWRKKSSKNVNKMYCGIKEEQLSVMKMIFSSLSFIL